MNNNIESSVYDKHYYDRAYQYDVSQQEVNLGVIGCVVRTATQLTYHFAPKSVLDFGCGIGHLVLAFRQLGVKAFGFDYSFDAHKYRLPDIAKYCWVQSVDEPVTGSYDMATCIEVAEHLTQQQCEVLIENLCYAAPLVCFSSSPDNVEEETHINVKSPAEWDGMFLKYGFQPVRALRLCPEWAVVYEKR